jgi:hypothetical protein
MGKNSVFAVKITIDLAQNYIVGVATGTALCLTALPIQRPPPALIGKDDDSDDSDGEIY